MEKKRINHCIVLLYGTGMCVLAFVCKEYVCVLWKGGGCVYLLFGSCFNLNNPQCLSFSDNNSSQSFHTEIMIGFKNIHVYPEPRCSECMR